MDELERLYRKREALHIARVAAIWTFIIAGTLALIFR
jgi:hypothetical protein